MLHPNTRFLNASILIEVTLPGAAGPFPGISQQLGAAGQLIHFAYILLAFPFDHPPSVGVSVVGKARLHPLCWALGKNLVGRRPREVICHPVPVTPVRQDRGVGVPSTSEHYRGFIISSLQLSGETEAQGC